MVYFGFVVGIVAGNIAAHAAHVDALRVYVATLVLIPAGLIGAKLLYVFSHWPLYRHNPRRIWDPSQGGAAQYGGLALVLPLSLPLLAALGLSFGAFWDVAVFTILLVMIFGRVGCLMNGCCAGRRSRSWITLYLPNRSGVWDRRIPTQCLEAGLAAVLLICAIVLRRSLPFPGALFLLVAAGYAAGRLVLESTRESQAGVRRFTIHHAISLLTILSSLTAVIARWAKVH
jgi:phosphatidylglycerol:prolipoprotein diacylglycerol transferase